MVVSGLGAAGNAGNASSLVATAFGGRLDSGPVMGVIVRGGWFVAVPDPPIHKDWDDLALDEAPGRAGNAGDEVAGDDVRAEEVHVAPGTARTAGAVPEADGKPAALPRRVLFFSFNTRVVCL